jgi:hypothetical protein
MCVSDSSGSYGSGSGNLNYLEDVFVQVWLRAVTASEFTAELICLGWRQDKDCRSVATLDSPEGQVRSETLKLRTKHT